MLKGNEIDLSRLPIQTCWPGEPAPLITWPLVVTKGPGEAREDNYNLGIYRMQVLNRNQTIMRWLRHRGGAQHHARWAKEKAAPLPAAIVLGADPGMILAAVTPIPDTVSEYQFAGLLRGRRVELADCVSQPLKVPSEAEIVLEGEVSLTDYRDEGPYGDHTGYYNSVEKFPVFTITAITMRRDPIYLSTYTGRPPDEPSVLGEALNEVFVPLIRQQFPEIVDFWLPPEGCSYRIAVVSMKKAYPGHAKRVMMAVWSYLRQFMYTKWVIVVDDDINARDWKDVMWAISTRMDPARDITVIETHARSTISTSPRPKAGLAPRSVSTPPTNGRRKPSANGAAKSAWTRTSSARSAKNGRDWACRERQTGVEVAKRNSLAFARAAVQKAAMVTKPNPQDLLHSLIRAARAAGADAADALFVENVSASVSYRLGKLEDVERAESNDLGLRVFVGQQSRVRLLLRSFQRGRGRTSRTRGSHGETGAGRQIRRPGAAREAGENHCRSRHRRRRRTVCRHAGRTRPCRRRSGHGREGRYQFRRRRRELQPLAPSRWPPARDSSGATPAPAIPSACRFWPVKAPPWSAITKAPARVIPTIWNRPKPSAGAPANAPSRVWGRARPNRKPCRSSSIRANRRDCSDIWRARFPAPPSRAA